MKAAGTTSRSQGGFIKSADSLKIPPDIVGAPEMTFSATKRPGSELSRRSQIQDGRWKAVCDDVK